MEQRPGLGSKIDALLVLGISVRRYLSLPMVLSLVLTMPLLYLFYACTTGLLGGMMVASSVFSGDNLRGGSIAHGSLPGHLDSNDMLTRTGPNELVASRSGRWGDRLSIGLRSALAENLQARLQAAVVLTEVPEGQAAGRLDVEVLHFDLSSEGTLILDARWEIRSRRALAEDHLDSVGLTTNDVPPGDTAQVTAMSNLVAQLAARIAPELR